jgi:Short C-terminal domain
MGLMFRRRRPIARVAMGAATAGVAYRAGQRRAEQQQYDDEAAYQATQAPPPQQYVPPAPAPPADDAVDQLSRLAALHESGALDDQEFAAAKASLLGL